MTCEPGNPNRTLNRIGIRVKHLDRWVCLGPLCAVAPQHTSLTSGRTCRARASKEGSSSFNNIHPDSSECSESLFYCSLTRQTDQDSYNCRAMTGLVRLRCPKVQGSIASPLGRPGPRLGQCSPFLSPLVRPRGSRHTSENPQSDHTERRTERSRSTERVVHSLNTFYYHSTSRSYNSRY